MKKTSQRTRSHATTRKVHPLRAWMLRVSFALLLLAMLGLVAVDRLVPSYTLPLRTAVMDMVAPVLHVFSAPFESWYAWQQDARGWVEMQEENARLKHQLARFNEIESVSIALSAENKQLRALLKLVPDPAVHFVSARLVNHHGGAFQHRAIILAGRNQGIDVGQAVTEGSVLVGRIVSVGNHSAQVMLITDKDSRIPVVLQESGSRAVLAGGGVGKPLLLQHLPKDHVPKIGEMVITSGDGGNLQAGLRVGAVLAARHDAVSVRASADWTRLHVVNIHKLLSHAEMPTLDSVP